jgi:glutaredoxin 1
MNKATIYGKDGCVWCDMAEALCKEKNIEYIVLKLGVDYEVEDFTSHFPYAKTVPQIYFNEKHIGGYESLTKIFIKE